MGAGREREMAELHTKERIKGKMICLVKERMEEYKGTAK